jgi:hypothetical protein
MARQFRLFSPRRLGLVLAGALLLCWPMLLLGGPLLFFDTPRYIYGGEAAVGMLLQLAADLVGAAGDAAGEGAAGGGLRAIAAQAGALRSVPWSIFAYLAALPFGPVGIAVVQNAIILVLFLPLLGGAAVRPRDAAIAAAGMALLTPLPWYGSYVMPDILAAAVILYGVLLAGPIDRLRPAEQLALGLLAAFAILSHHGHLPLAAAVLGAALGLRLVRGWLAGGWLGGGWLGGGRQAGRAVILAAGPPALAVMATLAGSAAVLDGPSVAPRRLPILLARSIEDGPARWHLEEHCATERYAMCEIFEAIPTNIAEVLWEDQGLSRIASTEQMQRVREEEPVILWRAFKEYPLQQSWSLARNTARQLVLVGGDDLAGGRIVQTPEGRLEVRLAPDAGRAAIDGFAMLWAASAIAAALWIAALAVRGRLARSEQDMAVIVAVGLVANAAIFGGLSAPVDRYQARIIWLVPALAAAFWLSRRGSAPALAPSPKPQGTSRR